LDLILAEEVTDYCLVLERGKWEPSRELLMLGLASLVRCPSPLALTISLLSATTHKLEEALHQR